MRQRGFTLLEALLSVAIITILAGMSVPLYIRFQQMQDLDAATQKLVGDLRQAALYSRNGYRDSVWSVHIASGSITLFMGGTYSGHNTAYDETDAISSAISLSGSSDVTFGKLYGQPTGDTASITLSRANISKTVTVNTYGMVNF